MILLASKSSGRLATLRAAGVDPLVRVSAVDEPEVLEALAASRAVAGLPAPGPADQVSALARAKALDVAATVTQEERTRYPDLVVVGCDSMLEIDGRTVGKPGSASAARDRWLAMRGRSGVLHSGHVVVRAADGETRQGVSSTLVRFGTPTEAEIDAYVGSGEPEGCAGAFTIDGLGGAFIDGIDGDPHGVVGISLPLMRRLLAELGMRWTDLWSLRAGPGSVH
ncbi:Maf family protein [Actinomyces howellii]|uniref:Nucleoside triphosphate pyrophosphatase n=1 Tax=Actinomyces howellii TaxID=52771 RepID=A0A3S4RY45_9ACTO|nr:nucleoside triphosphate pyrophosphatase [Actinomyces howellii]VEG29856.1 Septum formation protein Maf [Actinomyces howellii]